MKTNSKKYYPQLHTYMMLIICFFMSHIGFAQINGVIKNETGIPIANALVCHSANPNVWTKTDDDGTFSLPSGGNNTALRIGALHYETIKSQTIGSGTITMATDALIKQKDDVFHISFDHLRPGNSYSDDEVKDDFAVGSSIGFFDGNEKSNRAAVDYNESVDPGGVSIKAIFPKNGVKPANSGINARIPLKNTFKDNDFKSEDLYLSYWIKFADNFPFDKCGGKLPSLGGSDFNSRENTWKGRIMWRNGGSIQFYMELPGDGFNATNDERFWGKQIKDGGICDIEYPPYLASPGWHNIELHYKFESNGQNNGLFEGWVDGANYEVQNSSVFKKYISPVRKNITINNILLSTFFGGADDNNYRFPEDTHIWFDEFRVSETRINEYSKYNGGQNPNPTNNAPTVSITAPNNGASFEANDTLIIRADASDSDGRITKVEFYNGTTKLGEDSSAPYSLKVEDLKSGTYTLIAKATDNHGRSTTSSSRSITVGNDTSPDPDPTTCSFGTPTSSNLPSFNRSKFTIITVLGKGPNLDNISQLLINWNASKKGLYQFGVKTKDGKPKYYVDLREKISHNFGDNQPSITINNSDINGLDGSYWVAKDGTNFVMVSKSGDFSIYFSTGTAPNCNTAAKSNTNTEKAKITIAPNPASSIVTLSGLAKDGQHVLIYNTDGQLLLTQDINKQQHTNQIGVQGLSNGLYFVKVIDREGSTTKALKLLIKR